MSELPRGSVVDVIRRVENDWGVWYEVQPRGWASWLYLEPIESPDLTNWSPPVGAQVPGFLLFDPEVHRLEERRAELVEQLEEAERLFESHAGVAAQHGSRIYSVERTWANDAEDIAHVFEGPPDAPGIHAQETSHDVAIARELEQKAAVYERRIRRLQVDIRRLDKHVHRLRDRPHAYFY